VGENRVEEKMWLITNCSSLFNAQSAKATKMWNLENSRKLEILLDRTLQLWQSSG
jgi:hypothetical protein